MAAVRGASASACSAWHGGGLPAAGTLIGVLAVPLLSLGTPQDAPAPGGAAGDLTALMERVGGRVRQYDDCVTSVMCVETVSQQELRYNLKPQGRPRETVNDLMVVREPPVTPEGESRIQVERTTKSVNGRPVRKQEPPGCTDPKAITAEPLTFLLPQYHALYRFSRAGPAGGAGTGPPGAVAVDFEQIHKDPIEVKWDGLCFDARGGGLRGRIWLEASTDDVLQVEMRLTESFRVPPPFGLAVEVLPIRVERSEVTIRFARVGFEDPEETLLLPESMVTLTVFRGVPSLLTTQTFRGYRRFMARATIKGAV